MDWDFRFFRFTILKNMLDIQPDKNVVDDKLKESPGTSCVMYSKGPHQL